MTDAVALERTGNSGRGQWLALVVGALALAACIAGGANDPAEFFRAYLPAWLFVFGLSLGSMALLMIYQLTGGAWGFLIRRIVEAGMRTLPLVALMFLPIAFAIRYLYPFAQPEQVAANPQLQHQTFYLTPNLFWLRAACYFIVWLVIATLLSSWSRQQDEGDEPPGGAPAQRVGLRVAWKCRQLSAAGAVIYGVTLHFAAVDWAMAIIPAFHSSIWGPLFALGQLLSALAFTLIVLACKAGRPPLAEIVTPSVLGDLGSLLLTFLIAWAYMAFFQFMLIWIANLPTDIVYYLPRSSAYWIYIMWAVVLLGFVVPFFLLLMRPIKRNLRALASTAGLILVMQLLHVYYEITPSFPVRSSGVSRESVAVPPEGGTTSATVAAVLLGHWMDFLTPIALGGIWLFFFCGYCRAVP